jgi:hypothetical protein
LIKTSYIEKYKRTSKVNKLYKNIDLYASKLPIDTQVFHVNEDGTDFLYAEVSNGKDRVYSCEYFYGN